MAGVDDSAASIVLTVDDRGVTVAAIDPCRRCNVALIDELARIQLAVCRADGSMRLGNVSTDLAELIELVGLGDVLTDSASPAQASRRGGRP